MSSKRDSTRSVVEQLVAGLVLAAIIAVVPVLKAVVTGTSVRITLIRIMDTLRSPIGVPFWMLILAAIIAVPVIFARMRRRAAPLEPTERQTVPRGGPISADEAAILRIFAQHDITELPDNGLRAHLALSKLRYEQAIDSLYHRDFIYPRVENFNDRRVLELQPAGRAWLLGNGA